MNERCHTCKYWLLKGDRYNRVIFPVHPGSLDYPWESEDGTAAEAEAKVAAVFGHRVRYCEHPKVLFYQRPERDGVAVCDGSQYHAELLTAEDFGCVLHTPIPDSGDEETH